MKSTLIQLLALFDRADWTQFNKYVKGQHSSGTIHSLIVEDLQKHINTQEAINNSTLAAALKTKHGLPQDTRTIVNVLTQLTKTVESYMVQSHLEKNPPHKSAILAAALADRGAKDLFYKFSKTQENQHTDDLWQHYYSMAMYFNSYFGGFHDTYDSSKLALQSLSTELATFYSELSHFISLEMINREQVLQEDWQQSIIQLTTPNEITTPKTTTFKQLEELRLKGSRRSFDYLTKYLQQSESKKTVVNEIILVHLLSFINRQEKAGNHEYTKELLALYTWGVTSGTYLNKGIMSPRRYLNIVNTACALDQLTWCQSFIKEYSNLLDNKLKDQAIIVASSSLAFSRGEFADTLAALQKYRFKDFDLELRARILRLQCKFELDCQNIHYLQDEFNSMKYFIKRNTSQVSEATTKGILTLIKYLSAIARRKGSPTMTASIANEKYLMNKRWLLQQVEKRQSRPGS